MQIFLRAPSGPEEDAPRDWALLEMQGDLESRIGDLNMSEKFIGDLHYTKAGVPVLIIGHHILYGKVQQLDKPLVAMRKVSQNDEHMEAYPTQTEYLVQAIIEKKLLFKTRPKPIIANVAKKI
ncbi:hypothetical protein TCAL_07070 [Tigriopus californicus]|uniref:Chromosome transmission fidelity protein 8 homolog n=1 Tax=Tigriopus californicus TaxID=6832 RepID=A0A553PNV3_TIGCA|nr:chromosome transmission fidelity protein 8 homolog [Tigriopus californicus]TRY79359.1 hypothetical protein TCAL_07070 [Tigriopus californicus]|eukprot:TCALIF_07070-PA protein Name:"Similar to Chtf8 Chromosome transmission fidelity protein 8 homolog (Rattus norvegicus)" AED:0.03 eAED:0.03 QI:143/1/1/1/1/1/3/64/122